MKKITFLALLFFSINCYSQKFSTYIGLGLGGNVERKFPDYPNKETGRITAYVAEYYKVNDRYSIGLEAITSGSFKNNIGGNSGIGIYDIATNTVKNNYNNLSAESFLIRNKYSFTTEKKIKLYVDLGLGINIYFGGFQVNEQKIRKSSFVVSPEAGFHVSKFKFTCKAILGARTPAFTGFDTFSNQIQAIESISSQQLYFTIGYCLLSF